MSLCGPGPGVRHSSPALHALLCALMGVTLAALSGHSARPAAVSPQQTPSPPAPPKTTASEAAWLQRVRVWCEAIDKHAPGKADPPALRIASLPQGELNAVVGDVLALRDRLVKAYAALRRHPGQPPLVEHADWSRSVADTERLLGVRNDEAARGDLNGVVKRAALLHTDIALLVPAGVQLGSWSPLTVVKGVDGRTEDSPVPTHWRMARRLLDATTPDVSRSDVVRLWYRATAAHFLNAWLLAEAGPHLEYARRLFPDDGDVLFESGCLQEMLASARIQAVVRSAPSWLSFPGIASPQEHLKRAEPFLREAARLAPDRPVIREHLARVNGLLGRHDQAARDLRALTATTRDSLLLFFAQMFLGDEEQALGHPVAARACYERAASLYPHAQSPHMALSQLARRYGDRGEGLVSVRRMFRATGDKQLRYDPWLDYYNAPFHDAGQLFSEWRRSLPPGEKR